MINKNTLRNLFLVIFVITSMNAFANYPSDLDEYCNSKVTVRVASGQGKVYAAYAKDGEQPPSQNSCTSTTMTASLGSTKSQNNRPCKFYLSAKADEGYEFDYWECVLNEGKYDTDSNYDNGKKTNQVGDILRLSDSYEGLGGYWVVYAALSPVADGTINAIWEAHFKEITTQLVKVESEDNSIGTAIINKANNDIGYEVTITANCKNVRTMFDGWYRLNPSTGQKEFVTSVNPYTFTINDNNKGTYYAKFETGYDFLRLRNKGTNHYLKAKAKYTGSVETATDLSSALSTQLGVDDNIDASIIDEGTMMKVWVSGQQDNTHTNIWDIYVQDEHTSQYYDPTPGVGRFVVVNQYADNTYLLKSNGGENYLVEYNKSLRVISGLPDNKIGNWCFEGMDKDLTTKKNYFAVDPSEFVGPDNDGYYWTTLRVCFNMKYETSEITPYIVTAVDANAGTMELTEVTGGIIPAKECVLLRCNSTDITRNVMIPTTQAASFSPTGNLLISSTYYYKDQTVSGDAAFSGKTPKGIKLVDGRIGFGGSTKTSVDGNRAYLSVDNDVAVASDAESITLAQMLDIGNTDKKYRVTDLTCVDAIGNVLYCKDDNKALTKSVIQEGELDYVKDYVHLLARDDWDQSNWIAVTVPGDPTTDLLGSRLNNVIGHLTNTINPEFVAEKMPEAGESNPYTENTYITCNFVDEHQEDIMLNGQMRNCFFVAPKPMEIAKIEWAMWDAENEKFVKPTKDASALQGEFFANFTMLPLPSQPELTDGGGYHFKALIKNENVNSSTLKGEPTRAQSWVAYPLEWSEEGTVTDVDELSVSKVVSRIVYYNLMGQASMVPHCGINIVETRYSDGTRSVEKVMK